MGVGRKPAGGLLLLSMHVFIHLISRVLVRATCPVLVLDLMLRTELGTSQKPFTVSALLKDSTQQGVSPTNLTAEDLGLPNPAPAIKQVKA